jgi:hypothetical protein
MDVNIDQETIRRRGELRENKFWKVRQERDPERQRSLAMDLAAVRQKEVRDIQDCCALQREINEYKERQRLAREEVDNFVRTRAGDFDEGRLYEIAADSEAARNEVSSATAIEALLFSCRNTRLFRTRRAAYCFE